MKKAAILFLAVLLLASLLLTGCTDGDKSRGDSDEDLAAQETGTDRIDTAEDLETQQIASENDPDGEIQVVDKYTVEAEGEIVFGTD